VRKGKKGKEMGGIGKMKEWEVIENRRERRAKKC
jgi:hypothetical protein